MNYHYDFYIRISLYLNQNHKIKYAKPTHKNDRTGNTLTKQRFNSK